MVNGHAIAGGLITALDCDFRIAARKSTAGHFCVATYDESALWFERALAEKRAAVWINHNLAPAYALGGRKAHARRSLTELTRAFPELTIAQVRSGLPFRPSYLDRIAGGLEGLGMCR